MAIDVLSTLQAKGFRLSAIDGRIEVRPASRLTDADRTLIRQNRLELFRNLTHLEEQAASAHSEETILRRIAAVETMLRRNPLASDGEYRLV